MARIQTVALNFTAQNQVTPWIRHDYYETPFDVSLAFYLGSGLAGTFAVQYILDDLGRSAERQVLISQTTTVITVTDNGPLVSLGGLSASGALVQSLSQPGHGLTTTDYVQLNGSPGGQLDGGYSPASIVSATQYTLTSLTSQTLAAQLATVTSGRINTHATMTGMTARTVGNYVAPVFASRLICTAFTTPGIGYLVAMQGGDPS